MQGTISVSGGITTDGDLFFAPSHGRHGGGHPSCWRDSAMEHAQFVGLALCSTAAGARTGAGSHGVAGVGVGRSTVGAAAGVSASGAGAPSGGRRSAAPDESTDGPGVGTSASASGAGSKASASGAGLRSGAPDARAPSGSSRGRKRAQPGSRAGADPAGPASAVRAPNADAGDDEEGVREAWESGLQAVESEGSMEGSSEGEEGSGAEDAHVDKRVLRLQYSATAAAEGARQQGYLQAALQALPGSVDDGVGAD
eukprot:1148080-Pelagomonas_calceolata.AAC.2